MNYLEVKRLKPCDPSSHHTLGLLKVVEPREAGVVCYYSKVPGSQIVLEQFHSYNYG